MNLPIFLHLTANEHTAITTYLAQIHQNFPHQILRVILFGSKARGDAGPEADIDLLIVVTIETHEMRTSLWRIASDISLDFNVVLSPRIFGQSRWAEAQQLGLPLYRAVMADGIVLSPESIPA